MVGVAVGDHAMICQHNHGTSEKAAIGRVPARESATPKNEDLQILIILDISSGLARLARCRGPAKANCLCEEPRHQRKPNAFRKNVLNVQRLAGSEQNSRHTHKSKGRSHH